MNVETYSYTVVTTVLGMLVVFLSLTVLSLLMVVLKALFGERAAGVDGKAGEGAPALRRGGQGKAAEQTAGSRPGVEDGRQVPPWLTAAVAAYVAGMEGRGPSAEPWLPEFNHFDPWRAQPRSTRFRSAQTRE